jgi:hypothetical protein
MLNTPNGMTVKELKDYLKDLPEVDEFGEAYEVWLQTQEGLSSPVVNVRRLNQGDIILSHT